MDEIIGYLVSKGAKPNSAERISKSFERHADIKEELIRSIDRDDFETIDPVVVEGYTAKGISELAPFMNLVGAYNFLITLRENPQNAKAIIASGFPRK